MKYTQESINYIKESIVNINSYSPILLIGGASIYFKQRYKGKINYLESIEQVREFVADNINKIYEKPLVVDGVGALKLNAQSTLLKYIEEAQTPIILLAYHDQVSEIIKSRCKRVMKLPLSENVTSKLLDAKKAYEVISEYLQENTAVDDRERIVSETSPKLYALEKQVKNKQNKEKLIYLLS